jgi:hypothetical protein
MIYTISRGAVNFRAIKSESAPRFAEAKRPIALREDEAIEAAGSISRKIQERLDENRVSRAGVHLTMAATASTQAHSTARNIEASLPLQVRLAGRRHVI